MAKREEKITESKGPIQDLREWLDRVEQLGDLVRVKEAVSCEEEMSAIGYLVAKQKPSPAILFDNIKGYEKSPYKARRNGDRQNRDSSLQRHRTDFSNHSSATMAP